MFYMEKSFFFVAFFLLVCYTNSEKRIEKQLRGGLMEHNICKFPAPRFTEELSASAFVFEKDRAVMMQTGGMLCTHRLLLFATGEAQAQTAHMRYPMKSGTLLFLFAGERLSFAEVSPDASYLYMDFSGDRATELFHRFGIHAGNRVFTGYEGLIPLWRESLASASEMTVDLATESMLLYTLSRFRREKREENDLIGRIIGILEKRFTDPTLSLAAVAKMLSYNEKYLSHAFKVRMGVSFSFYLRSLRIKYAVSLFERGLDSVKNVAYLSGFSDPLYFSGVFKRTVGVSPKEYVSSLCEK